jgi:biopolymer transport protein ExbD
MITATVVQTNAIKVLLPQSSKKETQKTVVNITIDASLNYFIAQDKAKEMPVSFDEIDGFLKQISNDNPDKFLAIYADVVVPWGEVAKVTEIGYSNNYRLVLMTRPLNKK